jgi:DNA-binding transcriptional MerR regulator
MFSVVRSKILYNIFEFKESDFEWLTVINCLKNSGMPIKDIKILKI